MDLDADDGARRPVNGVLRVLRREGVECEVIAVDVATQDRTGVLRAALPGDARVVHVPSGTTFGDACNRGAAVASRSRYDAEEVFKTALPHLLDVQKRGCRTLVECTPAYLGRDPQLLARLSEASGLQILTNAGYYGAAKELTRFVGGVEHRLGAIDVH